MHILKSSARMYESSGSQFFRTTARIQSGPDTFGESRLFMTFLSNFGATEILCKFRSILDGKTDKDISKPLRVQFLEKISAYNFVLSDVEDNTSRLLNRTSIADLTPKSRISHTW